MAHTDRDDARWFWKDHFDWRRQFPNCEDAAGHIWEGRTNCWCHALPNHHAWANPYRYEYGVPSAWHKDQRRVERTRLRDELRRIRKGQLDWDEVPVSDGRRYRRPYYW